MRSSIQRGLGIVLMLTLLIILVGCSSDLNQTAKHDKNQIAAYAKENLDESFTLYESATGSGYSLQYMDLTEDGQEEIVLVPVNTEPKLYVLKYNQESFKTILEATGGELTTEVALEKNFLKVIKHSGGTVGGFGTFLDIYKWDGNKLKLVSPDPFTISETVYGIDNTKKEPERYVDTQLSSSIKGSIDKFDYRLVLKEYKADGTLISEKVKQHQLYIWNPAKFKFVIEEKDTSGDEQKGEKYKNFPSNFFSYKGVTLGMHEEKVKGLLGYPDFEGSWGEDEFTWNYLEYSNNTLYFDKATRKVITLGLLETSSGLKAGDPYQKIIDTHGQGEKLDTKYTEGNPKAFVISYKVEAKGVYFFVEDEKMTYMHIGELISE